MRVVLMRHGNSLANQENRIVSNPDAGCANYGGPTGTGFGLSDQGREEVVQSAASLAEYIVQQSGRKALPIRIVTSPFTRTQDTAQILQSELRKRLEVSPVETNHDLRERFFGQYDMQVPSDGLYAKVWREDAKDSHQSKFGVESVEKVTTRMKAVVRTEEVHAASVLASASATTDNDDGEDEQDPSQHYWVIIVSHGDALQILQTAMQGWRGERHRELENMATAGWREVSWDDGADEYN